MPHFLQIVVEIKVSGPPHVFNLWLGVSKGLLHVKDFCSIKASFCVSQISWRSHDFDKVEANPVTLNFGDLPDLKQLCLCVWHR